MKNRLFENTILRLLEKIKSSESINYSEGLRHRIKRFKKMYADDPKETSDE